MPHLVDLLHRHPEVAGDQHVIEAFGIEPPLTSGSITGLINQNLV